MFSMVETRLDITFAMFIVSRFAKSSSWQYIEVAKIMMQYFKAIKILSITYSKEKKGNLSIKGYSDLD